MRSDVAMRTLVASLHHISEKQRSVMISILYSLILYLDITANINPSNELHNGHWFHGQDW